MLRGFSEVRLSVRTVGPFASSFFLPGPGPVRRSRFLDLGRQRLPSFNNPAPKHPKEATRTVLIHPSAWKGNSANFARRGSLKFACIGFSEGRGF